MRLRVPKWTRDSGLLDLGDGWFERIAGVVVVIIALIVIFTALRAIFFDGSALVGI